MAKKGRALRPEELDLWKRVARHSDPLHPARPVAKSGPPRQEPRPKPLAEGKDVSLPTFRIGEAASPLSQRFGAHSDRSSSGPVAMDKKAFTRMKRGKLRVDARIDMHGMTLAQAHPRLVRFILEAFARGDRLVLVITGKGKTREDKGPIPERKGLMKHHVPLWLGAPGLGHAVLQVAEAHQSHGGSGAYYVYLRRKR